MLSVIFTVNPLLAESTTSATTQFCANTQINTAKNSFGLQCSSGLGAQIAHQFGISTQSPNSISKTGVYYYKDGSPTSPCSLRVTKGICRHKLKFRKYDFT